MTLLLTGFINNQLEDGATADTAEAGAAALAGGGGDPSTPTATREEEAEPGTAAGPIREPAINQSISHKLFFCLLTGANSTV
jgi:hypothetical protein